MRYSILTEEQQDGNWRVRLFYGGRTLHDTTVPEAHIPQAEQECWAAQEEHLLTHSVEIGGHWIHDPEAEPVLHSHDVAGAIAFADQVRLKQYSDMTDAEKALCLLFGAYNLKERLAGQLMDCAQAVDTKPQPDDS